MQLTGITYKPFHAPGLEGLRPDRITYEQDFPPELGELIEVPDFTQQWGCRVVSVAFTSHGSEFEYSVIYEVLPPGSRT